MAVFVLDKRKKPLMPCSEKRARKLLQAGRARVHRMEPFTIRLIDRVQEESVLQPLRLKIDPGSKTTGLALLREDEQKDEGAVVLLVELSHKPAISDKLRKRAGARRSRRSRNCRYRAPRFLNRRRTQGWLPPSLNARIEQTQSWVRRLSRWTPVSAISMEAVRFDMQKMEHPEISGVEYQQGELEGFEVKEYLLEKFRRTCAYCDATDVPLEVEHIRPRSKNGSNRVSNLTIACVPCNQAKDDLHIEEFLADQPVRLARVLAQLKAPLRDAAAVNSTRNALLRRLHSTGLPLECGSGGRTKYNRKRRDIPKAHALDALCVGESTPATIRGWRGPVLQIKASGRGTRQRTNFDEHGKARGKLKVRSVHGFRTGDLVVAVVPHHLKTAGVHRGRIAIRKSGSFKLGTVGDVSFRYMTFIQRDDGYAYSTRAHSPPD